MKSEQIAQLLPEVVRRTVHDGSAISDVIAVMEQLHAPVETLLLDFPRYLNPYRCPSEFVPMLIHWVGLGWLLADSAYDVVDTDEAALRQLVVHASDLAKSRGTRPGLERFLELATGVRGFMVAPDNTTSYGIDVRGPDAAAGHRALVQRVILHEKPAFVTASLGFGAEASERLISTSPALEILLAAAPAEAPFVF